ncbi:MAG: quinolinate synthase NadA [Clostridiales bacterium]|nr:quinolinate synthase NadA [Clostridiales bacterium]
MLKEIQKIKKEMGDKLYILAHHYEPDEIVACADAVGDSLKLARLAAENKKAEYIVFLRSALYGGNSRYFDRKGSEGSAS